MHREDVLSGADALQRHMDMCKRIAKTHDGFRRHMKNTVRGYAAQLGADSLRSRSHDRTATNRMRGQIHVHDSHDI